MGSRQDTRTVMQTLEEAVKPTFGSGIPFATRAHLVSGKPIGEHEHMIRRHLQISLSGLYEIIKR